MKADVISVEGKKVSEMELPKQFSAEVDANLIKRAVLATQSAKTQLKYTKLLAGRDNTAVYVGARGKPQMYRLINVEHARKPRLKNRRALVSGQVAGIPAVVGGPRAHPPKSTKINAEKINKKEKRKALESAIAATGNEELVKARGHSVPKVKLPIIVESKFEGIEKTKAVKEVFSKIGVWEDVERALSKKQLRPGKGKKRGRKYKSRKSVVIITEDSEKIFSAARNIPGVDIVRVSELNADVLAPGALPGRLAVWTENAVKALGKERVETEKADAKAKGKEVAKVKA